MKKLTLTSPEFEPNSLIPEKYTCLDSDINPPLAIENIPQDTVSLALIMDDPDAPVGTWDHWIVWNILPTEMIEENSVPEGSTQGKNSWGRNNYGGPCPPSGTHRYFFKLYALDTRLDLDASATKQDLENRMDGHIIEKTEMIGLFSK